MEHAHVCACTYIEGLLVACMKAAMPTAPPYAITAGSLDTLY